ncbi:hypothetical protein IMZ48_00750 [Candidatus Bathyarchaeota archaeon]|nr:hypothetical protein [Candidatus Bathyarchaeota archaeon]
MRAITSRTEAALESCSSCEGARAGGGGVGGVEMCCLDGVRREGVGVEGKLVVK